MEPFLKYFGYLLLSIGAFFMFVSAVGIIRMPDLYNRLQASTKSSTLGAMSIVMGVGILNPVWFFKCFIITLFIFITNPLSSSVLARASYKSGVPLCNETVIDSCKCLQKKREEEQWLF